MQDPDDLVSVYEAANSTEAYLVKDLLLDEEIEARVSDEHPPFAGLVFAPSDVLVARKNLDAAKVIVDAYEQQQIARADRPDWRCSGCGAEVVGAFDECDVCGAAREGTKAAEDA